MRCKNCGWPNRPGATECSKCGAPITEDASDNYEAQPPGAGTDTYSKPANPAGATVSDGQAGYADDGYHTGQDNFTPGKTVREDQVFGPSKYDAGDNYADYAAHDPGRRYQSEAHEPRHTESAYNQQRQPTAQARQCRKCGYPLSDDMAVCPNCNYDSSEGTLEQDRRLTRRVDHTVVRQPTRMNADTTDTEAQQRPQPRSIRTGSAKKISGTVNPYMMNFQPDPMFALNPIKRMNERHEPQEVELEGDEVMLTRDNTEPGNPSITSREQALITCEQGQWYIEDRSEQGTTFVRATHKVELHEGDVILLGNRLFEFHER